MHWLAGLLEGEGSFMWTGSSSAIISLQMTDRDVVARAAALLGCNVGGPYKQGQGRYKPTFSCRVNGKKAIGWMMTLWSLLGERRRSRINEIISAWRAYVPPKRPNRFAGTPYKKEREVATCHPGSRVVGWGLCGMCYMRQWRTDRNAVANGVLTIA